MERTTLVLSYCHRVNGDVCRLRVVIVDVPGIVATKEHWKAGGAKQPVHALVNGVVREGMPKPHTVPCLVAGDTDALILRQGIDAGIAVV
jgi:hypothetical protein